VPSGKGSKSGPPTSGLATELRIYGDRQTVARYLHDRIRRGRGIAQEADGVRSAVPDAHAPRGLIALALRAEDERRVARYEGRCARWIEGCRDFLIRHLGQRADDFMVHDPVPGPQRDAFHKRLQAAADQVQKQCDLMDGLLDRLRGRGR
jgi:hypothetical protein